MTMRPLLTLSYFPNYTSLRMESVHPTIRTFDAVEKAATKLLQILQEMMQIAIGFDIEWKPTFRKGNNNDVYLINWGGKERDKKKKRTLVDCLDEEFQNSWEAEPLYFVLQIAMWMKLLLEDPTVLKVGAGIDGDAVKVFRDYNISVKGVTDLSFHANRKLGGDHKWGLASLTEKLLSKQLKKPNKIRLGNWETPVLSKEQLEYAATDAFASWYLYQISRTPRKSLTEVAKLMVYLKNDYILSVY
ncbi:hypothetical protein JHK84_032596 [Glycine max]|uniref:3'-5' exonuclease n=1 Tax=Glycine soja TaxID=3848 RepID=A0A445HI80_GLYSO|nr:hypothetical protein JHK86_032454 [Glycine max]KAG5147053.1 hypothetical protein JHK84_032596 [Glycine max]RZB73414.1 Werner Syndrome-like exonuclease [Glycine soja]